MPRTGEGVAGIYFYPMWREYIETELKIPLQNDKCYYAECYVNLNNYSYWATDALGMYFSDTVIVNLGDAINYPVPLYYQPQIRNPLGNIIDDTVGWTKISGTFTAHGGEKYLLIGNFWKIEDCNAHTFSGNNFEVDAYYFIDDVLVMECPDTIAPLEVHNTVFIPNVFSPNKDGQNDDFKIYGENITQLNFAVYNRWGSEVFRTEELNTGWDGRYKNKDCSAGVYFYLAEVTFADGSSVVKKGNVTLIR
ncbi:MAG: gliding motility-associated C-terminal domain-containing protein [Bacteroidota bacterium]